MIIDIRGISFSFAKKNDENDTSNTEKVLDNITLEIEKGSFTAILGRNGSGKSTLAKHMNGLLVPQSGAVYVKGMNTCEEKNMYDIRSSAGMVFQNPDNQIVAAVVEDEVAFAPENLGVPPKEIRKRVNECLEAVGLLDMSEYPVSKLSGGQKQRLAIASVLAMHPEIIILDEPTAMLDPKGRADVLKTIKSLNKSIGMTVVLITHYMEEAAQASRAIVVDNGKTVLDGTPKDIFKQVDLIKSYGLNAPPIAELVHELNKSGIKFEEGITDEDECLSELVKLLGVPVK